MICLLPPRRPHCLEEEVANNEDDNEDNDAVDNNDDNEDMPPKAKPNACSCGHSGQEEGPHRQEGQ